MAALIVLAVVVGLILFVLAKTIRIVPQARASVVERFGRYSRTLTPGLAIVVPFVDRVRNTIDLREQVVSFPPQPVITEDNLVVSIDTVIYYQVTDANAATYEIANFVQAIEQLVVTTLRNVIGGIALEQTLTSRDQINGALRGVLDDATGKWGIRVNRVEIKAIDPPASVKDSMEKQMRADRDKRAAILTAEGFRQSQILTAEGEKQSSILRAEGQKQSRILDAQGQAQAIQTVFSAIHDGKPDAALLAYQYMQTLPQIAQGSANKMWIVPSEITQAIGALGNSIGGALGGTGHPGTPPAPNGAHVALSKSSDESAVPAAAEAVAAAEAAAAAATAEAAATAMPDLPGLTDRPGMPEQPSAPAAERPQPPVAGSA